MIDRAKDGAALALAIIALLLLGVIPGFVAFFFGFAWGLLASMASGAFVFWVAGKAGMNGGAEVAILGGGATLFGLIGGLTLRWGLMLWGALT